MFVNARPVGSQEIAYYGQNSTLYTVQLGVKAYRVADGSVLWTSSTEQVNFTSLNAAEKAREAIEPMLDTVDSRLAEFRSRGRSRLNPQIALETTAHPRTPHRSPSPACGRRSG